MPYLGEEYQQSGELHADKHYKARICIALNRHRRDMDEMLSSTFSISHNNRINYLNMFIFGCLLILSVFISGALQLALTLQQPQSYPATYNSGSLRNGRITNTRSLAIVVTAMEQTLPVVLAVTYFLLFGLTGQARTRYISLWGNIRMLCGGKDHRPSLVPAGRISRPPKTRRRSPLSLSTIVEYVAADSTVAQRILTRCPEDQMRTQMRVYLCLLLLSQPLSVPSSHNNPYEVLPTNGSSRWSLERCDGDR